METSALIFMATCWTLILGSVLLTMNKIIKSQKTGGSK